MSQAPTKSDPVSVLKLVRRIRQRVSRARIILETVAVDEFEDAADSLEQIQAELTVAEAEVKRLGAVVKVLKEERG